LLRLYSAAAVNINIHKCVKLYYYAGGPRLSLATGEGTVF
jgi:hypothetical protein